MDFVNSVVMIVICLYGDAHGCCLLFPNCCVSGVSFVVFWFMIGFPVVVCYKANVGYGVFSLVGCVLVLWFGFCFANCLPCGVVVVCFYLFVFTFG